MKYSRDELSDLLESLLDELGGREKNDEMSVAARFLDKERKELRRVDITAEKSSAIDTAYFLTEEAKDWDITMDPIPGDDDGVIVKKIAGKKVPFYCMAQVDTGDVKFVMFFENELPYIEDMHIIHAECDTEFVEAYVDRVVERAENDSVWRGHVVAVDNDGGVEEIDEEFTVSMDDLILTDEHRREVENIVESTDGEIADRLEAAGISASRGMIVYGPKGTGKALADDMPVLTPSGWMPICELNVDDFVIGSTGHPVRVLGVYPQGERDLYEVTFTDGASVVCDKDHLWTHYRERNDSVNAITTVVKTTEELIGKKFDSHYRFPFVDVIDYPEKSITIDPYLLGAIISDGSLTSNSVQWTKSEINNPDIVNHVRKISDSMGLNLTKSGDIRYHIVGKVGNKSNKLISALKEYGLWGAKSSKKFIPHDYIEGSIQQRIALINGLFDGDGSVRHGRNFPARYRTMSQELAENVQAILWSLGCQSTINCDTEDMYTVNVSSSDFNPFLYSRNKDKLSMGNTVRSRRSIKSIEPYGRGTATCIKVDADDELFVTKDYVLTHNTTISRAIISAVQGERTVIISQPGGVIKAFQLARRCGSSVIILDDIDISVGNRERGNHTGLLTAMLTEMDGPVQNGRILTYATANNIGNIDTALQRQGRFDSQIELDQLPTSILRDMANEMAGKLNISIDDLDDQWFDGKTPADVTEEMKVRVTNKARGVVGTGQKKQFGFR